ncbi:hypothetical protein ACET3Z_004443 [Daucus carota]
MDGYSEDGQQGDAFEVELVGLGVQSPGVGLRVGGFEFGLEMGGFEVVPSGSRVDLEAGSLVVGPAGGSLGAGILGVGTLVVDIGGCSLEAEPGSCSLEVGSLVVDSLEADLVDNHTVPVHSLVGILQGEDMADQYVTSAEVGVLS